MATDFSSTSQELMASIQIVVQKLDELSKVSIETSNGTTAIAHKSKVITEKASNVFSETQNIKTSVDELIKSISRFKF
jgi:methyl-accepting chemotaxis protein